MSITGAVNELNKEIDRLTKFRDALLEGSPGISMTHAASPKPGRKPGPAKKAAGVKEIGLGQDVFPAKEENAICSWKKGDLRCRQGAMGREEESSLHRSRLGRVRAMPLTSPINPREGHRNPETDSGCLVDGSRRRLSRAL